MLAESRTGIVNAAMRHLRDFFAAESVVLLAEESRRSPRRTTASGAGIAGRRARARDRALGARARQARRPRHRHAPGLGRALPPARADRPDRSACSGSRSAAARTALTPSQRQLLETFVAQIAQALDRVRLSEEAAAARLAAETERTRSTLLSAVSHDLRTPLATISGAAEALLQAPGALDAAGRRDLLETIREEVGRLTRVINDLLDLTRLEAAGMQVLKEWHPLEEIVAGEPLALEIAPPRPQGRARPARRR